MSQTSFKRVISNPDRIGRHSNSKISKTSDNYVDREINNDSIPDMISSPKQHESNNITTALTLNSDIISQTNLAAKQVHLLTSKISNTSTSTGNVCGADDANSSNKSDDYGVVEGLSQQHDDKAMAQDYEITNSVAENKVKDSDVEEIKPLNQDIAKLSIRRKVSNDDVETAAAEDDESGQINDNKANLSYHRTLQTQTSISHLISEKNRTKSDSTDGSKHSAGRDDSGNWGWFENVHEHDNDNGKVNKQGKNKSTLEGSANHPVGSLDKSMKDEGRILAVTAPTYVLEESLSSQNLWKHTAGTRPPQPVEERAFYEKMWAQNFARSQVSYKMPAEVLMASSPISLSPFADGCTGDLTGADDECRPLVVGVGGGVSTFGSKAVRRDGEDGTQSSLYHGHVPNKMLPGGFYGQSRGTESKSFGPHDHHHTLVNKKVKGDNGDDELTVVVKGDNVFGTTVSKSFPKIGNQPGSVDTVSISIASYRVVESKKHGKYAQFLVIYCEGSFHDTVGVWKRYSDFDKLSRKVTNGDENCTSVLAGLNPLSVTADHRDGELLPNAITSWKLLKKRQRWYRCLDAGYLSLKVFLLERFLHDILFESSSPAILRDFVGVFPEENVQET